MTRKTGNRQGVRSAGYAVVTQTPKLQGLVVGAGEDIETRHRENVNLTSTGHRTNAQSDTGTDPYKGTSWL